MYTKNLWNHNRKSIIYLSILFFICYILGGAFFGRIDTDRFIHDITIVTRGTIDTRPFLSPRDGELLGDVSYVIGDLPDALRHYKNIPEIDQNDRILEKISLLSIHTGSGKTQSKMMINSGSIEIQQALDRIEADKIHQKDFLKRGATWSDTHRYFTPDNSDIDW